MKYSRAFEQPKGSEFKFETLFKSFRVPQEADFIIFASLYPNIDGAGDGKKSDSWRRLLLVFTRKEMEDFVASLRTKSGNPDRMFYFGFDDTLTRIVQTRGAPKRPDYAKFTLQQRLPELREFLDKPR